MGGVGFRLPRVLAVLATIAAPAVAHAHGQELLLAGAQVLSVALVALLALVVVRGRETRLMAIVIAAGACFFGTAIADHLQRPGWTGLLASGFLPPLAAAAAYVAWARRPR